MRKNFKREQFRFLGLNGILMENTGTFNRIESLPRTASPNTPVLTTTI